MYRKLFRTSTSIAALVILGSSLTYGQANLPDPFPHPPSNSGYYYENLGQVVDELGSLHPEIKYYTEKTFPALYLADNKVSFVAFTEADTVLYPGASDSLMRIDLRFACEGKLSKSPSQDKVNCGIIKSYEQSGDHLNYYLPHCGAGITNVPGYARVVYENAYPDIDVHFYSNAWAPKIYFVIKPGGNPNDILLELNGQDSINMLTSGALAAYLRSWTLQFPQAISYQIDASNNTTIMPWLPVWNHAGGGMVNIAVGSYNPTETLVIAVGGFEEKPTDIQNLGWSVYYGGQGTEKYPKSFANDNDELYHVMSIRGFGFPSLPGDNALPTYYNGNSFANNRDWYVTRFDANGVRKWASYYGGLGEDVAMAIEEQHPGELTGQLWVAGMSLSDDIVNMGTDPAVFRQGKGAGPFPDGGHYNGLLGAFKKSNGELEYATFIGDRYGELSINDISIDNISNSLYFAGTFHNYSDLSNPATTFNTSCSPQITGSFPLCAGTGRYFQGALYQSQNDYEGYIGELNLSNKSLVWSTLFGGYGKDQIYSILKVHNDGENALYIAGGTGAAPSGAASYPSLITSNNLQYFPLANPGGGAFFQTSSQGHNFFIAKFNSSHKLAWSTFLGRSNGGIRDLAINSQGKLYFTGNQTDLSYAAPNSSSPNASGLVPAYTNGTSYTQTTPLANSNTIIGRFDVNHALGWSAFLPGPTSILTEDGSYNNQIIYSPSIGIDNSNRVFFGNYLGICNADAFLSSGNYYEPFNASQGTTHQQPLDGYLMVFKANESINWSTFFGGTISPAPGINSLDAIADLSIAGSQYLYLTGITGCPNAPYKECLAIPGSYCDMSYNYGTDCFISRFDITNLPDPTPLSINESNLLGNKMIVYPNPATGKVILSFLNDHKDGFINIRVTDITGRLMMNKQKLRVQSGINQYEIDTQNFAPGMYLIELNNELQKHSIKFNKL